jgi:hypothetical protein
MKVMFIPNDYRVDPFIAVIGESLSVVEHKPSYAICHNSARVGSYVRLRSSRDDTPVEVPQR